APRAGSLNAAPDRDGILRRAPLVVELDGRLYPSFALAVYSAIADVSHPELDVSTVNASTLRIGNAAVPLDAKGSLLLAFRGGKRTFPYVSAVDALNGAAGDALRDRIVLVGTTALGTREVVATPLDTQFVGVEVQATAIDNLLQHDFVHRSQFGASIDAAIVVLACGAVAALAAGAGVTASVSGAAVLIGLSWWGSVWLLTSTRLFVSPLAPVAGVLL